MGALTLTRAYHPGAFAVPYADDPEPAVLPAAPLGYYGAAVLNARAVALAPTDRPQLFPVVDAILGPGNVTLGHVEPNVLATAVETVALLGMNTIRALSFGDQTAAVQGVLASWGITRYQFAVYQPQSAFSWDAFSDAASVAAWAADIAWRITNYLAVPLAGVVLYHLDDEPAWYFPGTTNALVARPTGVAAFRAYLADLGFAPSDLGGTTWDDILPIGASAAVDLPTRRLFFHTVRFIAISYAEQQAVNTAALRTTINGTVLTAVNYNNGPRWFIPAANRTLGNNPDSGPDAAQGQPDWSEYGHRLPMGAHWSEDWDLNLFSEYWSYRSDMLRSATALTAGTTWGGYVVGQTLVSGTPAGGRYKALALLGKGAKILEWYTFGPAEQWGNGYSQNVEAYPQIADANRLIAHAEDMLFPGQPSASPIAVLVPYSAQVWDVRASDPAEWPRFLIEVTELQLALAHAGYQLDYLSEFDVAARLDQYHVLYVTAPNLAAAAQSAIAAWIAAGGVAYFGPGTACGDEYNTPVTTLDAVKGITTQTLDREYANETWNTVVTSVDTLDVTVAGHRLATPGTDTRQCQVERLAVTTATVLAQFTDDSAAAVVAQATGTGWAITSGVFLIHNYGASFNQDPTGLLINWNARLRGILTMPVRLAGVVPSVTCDQAMVESARLDSAAGVAVTLFNWNDAPLPSVTVTLRNCPVIARAVLADAVRPIGFTQEATTVTVVLPLATVDVLKLYAA